MGHPRITPEVALRPGGLQVDLPKDPIQRDGNRFAWAVRRPDVLSNWTGQQSMASQPPTVDQIVQELLDRGGTKVERMKLFRELVRRGEDLPDELLNSALQKLMERLAE